MNCVCLLDWWLPGLFQSLSSSTSFACSPTASTVVALVTGSVAAPQCVSGGVLVKLMGSAEVLGGFVVLGKFTIQASAVKCDSFAGMCSAVIDAGRQVRFSDLTNVVPTINGLVFAMLDGKAEVVKVAAVVIVDQTTGGDLVKTAEGVTACDLTSTGEFTMFCKTACGGEGGHSLAASIFGKCVTLAFAILDIVAGGPTSLGDCADASLICDVLVVGDQGGKATTVEIASQNTWASVSDQVIVVEKDVKLTAVVIVISEAGFAEVEVSVCVKVGGFTISVPCVHIDTGGLLGAIYVAVGDDLIACTNCGG